MPPQTEPLAARIPGGSTATPPVIDFARPAAEIAPQIDRACREWGFFQLVGHGIPRALTDGCMGAMRDFFALPKPTKRALSRSLESPWGFYDRELTKNTRDKKEVYDIGPDAVRPAPERDPFAGETPWPEGAFRETVTAYFRACQDLSDRLLAAIAEGMGAPPLALAPGFCPAHTGFLRLNYYPVADPLADDEAAAPAGLGIHPHSDSGALTVLLQDQVSGLQVLRDGAWHDVPPRPDALVINIGDMMQVWSNDRYAAPVHRVLPMDRAERYSAPYFHNPAYGAVVEPLAAVLGPGRPSRYRPVSWAEFRRRRADGDFGDYGPEVQISDYRLDAAG